jgi:threonine aldolase
MKKIDFRSDTVTLPTDKMRQAILTAELGDDVTGEDPTVNKLQALAAEVTGKEDALLVTSGTMGNQLSIKVHTVPGNEIIVEEKAHIFLHELGASAVLSGVQTKAIKGMNGILDPEMVEKKICLEDDHTAGTKLICLENSHNMAGGVVMSLDIMKRFRKLADRHNIKLHLDGARLFNAATYLNVDVKEITRYADSVTFCLSKGLCAPVGSMLCGSKEFISKAHRFRKMFGGGMRQAGIIAAPGIIAIEEMSKRLGEDHENAKILGEGISQIPGLSINPETVQTNMVFFKVKNATGLVKSLEEKGILCWDLSPEEIRMVIHYYITREDVLYTLDVLKSVMQKSEK